MTEMETIVDVLESRAQAMGATHAFEFSTLSQEPKSALTYAALRRQAEAVELYLRECCAPRSRIAICLPTGPHFIAGIFGVFQAGCIAVPVYPAYRGDRGARLAGIIADCSPAVLFVARADKEVATKIATPSGANVLVIEEILAASGGRLESNRRRPRSQAGDLAILQYTSGSTADPKGVMITHGNLLHNSKCIAEMFGHDANSRGVIWLPPHHDMGLVGGILQPVFAGFPTVLVPPSSFLQNPYGWLRLISEERATVSGGPNLAYEMCLTQITDSQLSTLDLSAWKVAFNGSEAVSLQTLHRFAERFSQVGFNPAAFCPCYGLAESTLLVTAHRAMSVAGLGLRPVPSAGFSSAAGVSSGVPGPDIIVKIVDSGGKEMPEGSVGEIWVASPSNAVGYWNRAAESDETFRARLPGTEGCFVRTGDLGLLRGGELIVQGRAAEIIVVGGVKFHPSDIENWLLREGIWPSRPTIAALPGPTVQDDPGFSLVVEIAPANELDPEAAADRAIRAVKRQFGIAPSRVAFVTKLGIPRTPTGKLRRFEAARRLERGELKTWRLVVGGTATAGDDFPESSPDFCAQFVAILKKATGDRTITAETNLLGLGLTSMELLTVSKMMRERTGIRIDLEAVFANPTPQELARAVGNGPERLAPIHDKSH